MKNKYRLLLVVAIQLSPLVSFAVEFDLFPSGHLFLPLLSDPKESRFQMDVWWIDSSDRPEGLVGTSSLGEAFEVFRWSKPENQSSLSLGISGGAVALFDLLESSIDLVNVDFSVGFPLTFRAGKFSNRTRFYHWSSHLGDEFLINYSPARINVSVEALELLGAYDLSFGRVYGGGEIMLRREPELERSMIHLGFEYRQPESFYHFTENTGMRCIGGLDVKMWEFDDFRPAVSLKFGIQVGRENDVEERERILRLFVEFYDGLIPHGQFWAEGDHLTSVGIGFQIHP